MNNKNIIQGAIVVLLIIIIIVALVILKLLPVSKAPVSTNEATTTIATTTETAPFSNTTEEGYSSYVNKKYGFSIMYPTSLARINMGGDVDGLDTADIFIGNIPKDTFKGTNLYEVKIIAGAKTTDQNICSYIIYGNDVNEFDTSPKFEHIKINGIDFIKVRTQDAGLGNVYETFRYSTYKNGTCYELLAVAHSGNIGIVQESDPTIKQYDSKNFMAEFEEIVSFFKFIN